MTGPSSSAQNGARYRDILDHMSDMVCRFAPDRALRYANPSFCDLLDVDPEALNGARFLDHVHPDDRPLLRSTLARLSPQEPELETTVRVVRSSDGTHWTRWTLRALFDERGRVAEVQASGRDVSEAVGVEQRLRKSLERGRFLSEASELLASSLEYEVTLARVTRLAVPLIADSCSVSLVDPRAGFTRLAVAHVDPTIERELEAQPRSYAGELPEGLRALAAEVLAGRTVRGDDVPVDSADDVGFDAEDLRVARLQQILSYMIVPMVARGRTVGAMSLLRSRAYSNRCFEDDDQELAGELARRAAVAIDNARLYRELEEADRRKDQFLATLAHELRNPMAAISAALDALQEGGNDPEVHDKALSVARRQVSQQARMVDDLLDVSRLTRGRVRLRCRPLRLRRALEDIVESHRPLAARRGQKIAFDDGGVDPQVDADANRIHQIAANLLDNALKFTPTDGVVEVSLRSDGREACFAVRDRGPGIAPDLEERMFDLFVQGQTQHNAPSSGLGIGLTIARELVHLHGGTIEARNREGGGAEVVVRLPVERVDEGRESRPTPQAQPVRGMRVLVVDDNTDAADMLAIVLSRWGLDVGVAYDGTAALADAAAQTPALVLLDLGMPGLDGFETAKRMRTTAGCEQCYIVALTGYSQPKDVSRTWSAGFDRHEVKPIEQSTLREVVAEASARLTDHR